MEKRSWSVMIEEQQIDHPQKPTHLPNFQNIKNQSNCLYRSQKDRLGQSQCSKIKLPIQTKNIGSCRLSCWAHWFLCCSLVGQNTYTHTHTGVHQQNPKPKNTITKLGACRGKVSADQQSAHQHESQNLRGVNRLSLQRPRYRQILAEAWLIKLMLAL